MASATGATPAMTVKGAAAETTVMVIPATPSEFARRPVELGAFSKSVVDM